MRLRDEPLGEDDLNRPLGIGPQRHASSRRGRVVAGLLAGAATLGLVAVLMGADPRGGEPFAVASLPPFPKPSDPAPVPAGDPMPTGSTRSPSPTSAPPRPENGVTVLRAGQGAGGAGPLVIKVPQALGLSEVASVDKRLVEATRYGPLPRIAADGARSSEVYARPPVFSGTIGAGSPRVAVVVSGLGSDATLTDDAIRQMPAAVTLAFSPYGKGLDGAAERAKAAGHEVLLQIATASVGASAPHALRVGATQAEVLDDLRWMMGRMSGYVGIGNFHGSPLAADQSAMTTMFQELGGRGLLYAEEKRPGDNAASPTGKAGLPTVGADLSLEAGSDAATVRAATVKLEALARAKGSAVLAVDASPAALAALAGFAETLEARGLVLVPVSSLASTSAPSVARAP